MSDLAAAVRGSGPVLAAPIVFRLAARLEQVELDEMLEDPATAAFVLRSAQSLFGSPLVVNQFQLGLEVESLDGPLQRDEIGNPTPGGVRDVALSPQVADTPLMSNAVDVAGRLSSELRGTAQVLGVLTGPATLAELRGGSLDGLAEMYAVMARRYAEAGVAGVLLAERPGAMPTQASTTTAATLAELANICRYYSVASIWLAPSTEPPEGPVDVVLGAADVVPADVVRQPPADDAASRWTGRTGLLLTSGELPADADPENVTAWVERLGGVSLGTRR
ncbi:MAG: hypothetical protein JWR85_1041 [Marmoricola sp.]|jgi:hypothetical protein|nr:hypothetical protein [Marmoricola sp.]